MAAVMAAAGAKDVALPDPDGVRVEFDDWLVSEFEHKDPERYELMRALGVA